MLSPDSGPWKLAFGQFSGVGDRSLGSEGIMPGPMRAAWDRGVGGGEYKRAPAERPDCRSVSTGKSVPGLTTLTRGIKTLYCVNPTQVLAPLGPDSGPAVAPSPKCQGLLWNVQVYTRVPRMGRTPTATGNHTLWQSQPADGRGGVRSPPAQT